MPEWHNIIDQGLDLPEWVWRSSHVDSLLGLDVPPVVVWRSLVMFSGLKYGTRSMALWLATYVGGKDKVTAGKTRGSRTHCWPKAEHLAARSGASERTVRQHLLELEHAGWLIIERHKRKPSDYWLAVPDAAECPYGCENARAEETAAQLGEQHHGIAPDEDSWAEESSGQGADSSGHERQKLPVRAADSSDALGSALGSSKDSFQERPASTSSADVAALSEPKGKDLKAQVEASLEADRKRLLARGTPPDVVELMIDNARTVRMQTVAA